MQKKKRSKKPTPTPVPLSQLRDPIDEKNIKTTNKLLTELLRQASDTDQYKEAADKHAMQSKQDFNALATIITEYMGDFILIGHTLDDQRVVVRCANTPGDEDKLTELCKKVLIGLLANEETGM